MEMIGRSRGSIALEHAVLAAIVMAALVGMSVYLKRAICGRWKAVGDTFGYGRQYDSAATTVRP